MVLIMTVNPGFSGQGFIPEVSSKIKELRQMKKDLDIEVDGGIKIENAKIVVEAGANILVSASGIYNFKNKKEIIEKFKQLTT
jgi:ribulose-phosphate 3-epimerase